MSGLSHPPSQIIRQLLIDLGQGSDHSTSWPVYSHQGTDSPDAQISVVDTAGIVGKRFQQSGAVHELRGIQIFVRAEYEQKAYMKADAIKEALLTQSRLVVVHCSDTEEYGTDQISYLIYNVLFRSGPFPVNQPGSDRRTTSTNFLVNLKQLT